jgi:cytidine deaminase
MTPEKLCELAVEAMGHAYVPYSGYKVGAALLCKDGTVYQGCNIENASYSPTNCAERTAFFKAVYDGKREFTDIAVCGGKDGVITGAFPPCGVCRQVMREFCEDDFRIHMVGADGSYETFTLAQILPHSFRASTHMAE